MAYGLHLLLSCLRAGLIGESLSALYGGFLDGSNGFWRAELSREDLLGQSGACTYDATDEATCSTSA